MEGEHRHIENLLKMRGLDTPGAKGCATPWNKGLDKMTDGDKELHSDEAAMFGTGGGIS